MSQCARFQEALWVADVAELQGCTDSELSRHVAECSRCRAVAERLGAANGALDDYLSQAPPIDVDVVLRRAELRRDPPRVRGLPMARWSALAAAAAIGALLIARGGQPRLPGAPIESASSQRVEYEAPVGRNLAVLPTRDPDITVLWLF